MPPTPPPDRTWLSSRPRSPLAWLLPRRSSHDAELRAALGRLLRLNGPGELRAALLMPFVRPGGPRERAWHTETLGVPGAGRIWQDLLSLPPAARLPCLEVLARRAAAAPLEQRRYLVEAVRRVMRADGRVEAIDRLWWLALRHRLGDAPPATLVGDGDNDLRRLDETQLQAVGVFSAFLARLLVPAGTDAGAPLDRAAARWHGTVMRPFEPRLAPAAFAVPDADATVRALRVVQTLPWMMRPVLLRDWCDAAAAQHAPAPLAWPAADVLRLTALLLDSPLPAVLSDLYIDVDRPHDGTRRKG